MDLTQDLDEENSKAKNKTRGKQVNEMDDVEEYFDKPVNSKGQVSGPPLLYKCKWCGNSYKRAVGTRANLFKHRDGNKNRSPCAGRADAISAGATLPVTVKEIEAQKRIQQAGIMTKGDDNGDENGICDSNDENVSEEVMCRSTSHTAQVLKKVDFQRITLSAAKQSEFNTWSKKLEYHGPTLIAGYGIRLNIKYESRNHGYQACNVINKLIENKKDPQERDGGKDFFNKYEISRGNWEIVKKLNDILREFYYITKKMEGDSSSACLMLSKYKAWYPSHYSRVEALLSKHFNQQTVDIKANASQVISSLSASDEIRTDPKDIQHHCQVHTVDFFPDASSSTHLIELSIYLSGKYKLATDQAGQSLKWWKEHHQEFPVLSSLAKDFLACCSTSASVKRCFSAAADICGRDCGSLAVRTIE
ncbi:hypothetical protein PCANC_03861 [Puccinia coronata f. sp. avenae]|uniref:HAT C-terminal dimerisation domain-containing protein n=1 Tax=Puccinia coronata f. sp. avenae TaxID=200324 RepID=A0A2N5T7G5_9BASI|nr:hypothetical protein PCANC_03861 [Puccinia coronata f. sp. avenae]